MVDRLPASRGPPCDSPRGLRLPLRQCHAHPLYRALPSAVSVSATSSPFFLRERERERERLSCLFFPSASAPRRQGTIDARSPPSRPPPYSSIESTTHAANV